MTRILVGLMCLAWFGGLPVRASAQPLMGFSTFSLNTDLNDQTFAGAAGGVLLDLAHSWVSVGAQADIFVSWPYFAGRVGPLAQLNLVRRHPLRLFAIGGLAWGEQAGPMVGAGVEVWTRERIGLRATVQDYLARVEGFDCAFFGIDRAYCDASFHGGRAHTAHQLTVQVGIVWR